ncbi:DeoR family transcriptional regulator [Bacillus tianshenii]|nr:DeoR family transcriptional regulator [Bacillus tianshenii]
MSPATSRMLNRVKSVYLFINERGMVSTQELVEEFGTTSRTIQRDLNVLEYNNLVHSPSRGRWTTTRKRVKVTS